MLKKVMAIMFALGLAGVMAVPSAFAMQDMLNFKTNAPLELPGRVISPGKYAIMNATPNNGMPVVEVMKRNGDPIGFFQTQDVLGSGQNKIKVKREANAPDRLDEFFSRGQGYKFEYPVQKPLA